MNNCLLWALPRWLRNYLRGEALVIRKSAHTWVPHFMRASCIGSLMVSEYVPPKTLTGVLRWIPIHALFFRGTVRHGPADCICKRCAKRSPSEL